MAAQNEIMWTYYYINQYKDNPQPGWKPYLQAVYTKKHPELHLTEQNVVERKCTIVKKSNLTAIDLGYIKREVGQFDIQISNPETQIQPPSHLMAKYRHFKEHQEGQGEYVEMTGEWNEAHLAFYCVAVTTTEVEGQNTHFPLIQNDENNNIKVKEPDLKNRLIKNDDELCVKADVTDKFLKGNCS